MTIGKDLNYYLSLPYTIELVREDKSTWFARVAELPGCMTEADSSAEAVAMLYDAMSGWLEVALADGQSIPEPRAAEDYSGKFVVRVPKSLHRDLVAAADRDGVSLNHYIGAALAHAVGRSQARRELDASAPAAAALAELTSTDQLTLSKEVLDKVAAAAYFVVAAEGGRIVLTPLHVNRSDAVREKLAELGITEADVEDAVQWARQ